MDAALRAAVERGPFDLAPFMRAAMREASEGVYLRGRLGSGMGPAHRLIWDGVCLPLYRRPRISLSQPNLAYPHQDRHFCHIYKAAPATVSDTKRERGLHHVSRMKRRRPGNFPTGRGSACFSDEGP